jgi:hypothetical protein
MRNDLSMLKTATRGAFLVVGVVAASACGQISSNEPLEQTSAPVLITSTP